MLSSMFLVYLTKNYSHVFPRDNCPDMCTFYRDNILILLKDESHAGKSNSKQVPVICSGYEINPNSLDNCIISSP